ncbi:MAG: hypothetical protein ABII02_03720 [Candidatus Magasanikbacteria bacterium]
MNLTLAILLALLLVVLVWWQIKTSRPWNLIVSGTSTILTFFLITIVVFIILIVSAVDKQHSQGW